MIVKRFPVAGLLALGLVGWGFHSPPAESSRDLIRKALDAAELPAGQWPDFSRQESQVSRIYAAEPDSLVWFEHDTLITAARSAADLLHDADTHGLDPADYDASAIDALITRRPGSPADTARLDLLLTVDLLRLLENLHDGRIHHPPLSTDAAEADTARIDFAAALRDAVAGDSVVRTAIAVSPQLVQYRNLRGALLRYRALVAESLPPIPAPARKLVQPGDSFAGTAQLALRLAATGDFTGQVQGGPVYQGAAVEAVRRFQQRHGLAVDGVLGPETIQELSVPFSRRVREIQLALERLRWLPPLGRRRFIVVNIPAFQLYAFDSAGGKGLPQLQMPVIVGKALDTRTPLLYQSMKYVAFHPYWNVPRSILKKEILPKLRRNPDWLRSDHMEIVDSHGRTRGNQPTPDLLEALASGSARVRQLSGPFNALGPIKFAFPNAEAIYLHGTPDTTLFDRTRRDLSHGCIRVMNPRQLAAWVLAPRGWSSDSVDAALADSSRLVVPTPAIPVIVYYATAAVHPDGTVYFYRDVYGHDRQLERQLGSDAAAP